MSTVLMNDTYHSTAARFVTITVSYSPGPWDHPNSPERTPSPVNASPQPTPAPSSAVGGFRERQAKRGDLDYVKRPPNAFMLFRSHSSKILAVDAEGKKRRQLELNSIISQQWRALPLDERAKWDSLAAERKVEHKTRYPDYKYKPCGREAKTRVPAACSSPLTATQSRNDLALPQHGSSAGAPSSLLCQANVPSAILPSVQSLLTTTSGILSLASSTFGPETPSFSDTHSRADASSLGTPTGLASQHGAPPAPDLLPRCMASPPCPLPSRSSTPLHPVCDQGRRSPANPSSQGTGRRTPPRAPHSAQLTA